MRVAIDARLVTSGRGMGNFVSHLLQQYATLAPDSEFILYVDSASARAAIPDHGRWRIRNLGPWPYPLWEQLLLPLAVRGDRPDVLHCPANTGPLRLPGRTQLVLTIHDVMYLLPETVLPRSPSLYQRLGRTYRRGIVPRVARRANLITTDSHYSRRDIERYLDVRGVPIEVVPGAPKQSCRRITDEAVLSSTCAKLGLKRPYIFGLGATDPRKNTRRIVQAFARFRTRVREPYQLALAGLSVAGQQRCRELAASLKVSADVVCAGFVSDEELAALYSAASAFVYPSMYEGFGLPALEAMRCGVPVVASTCGSLPEVAGDAAILVDPSSTDAICRGLVSVATDRGLREALIAKGFRRAEAYSWQGAAGQMLSLYQRVHETANGQR